MKPLIHAQISVKRYGGFVEDYLPIHNFMDSSKDVCADMRHRAMFHHSKGPFICEQIFGVYITLANGNKVSVRDIAEDHIKEDLGFIPDASYWIRNIKEQPWMYGNLKGKKRNA